jgi:hypothetical protein
MNRGRGAEQRASPRNKTYVKVLLGSSGVPGYIRNLSREGCQLAFTRKPGVKKGDLLDIEVLPSEEMATGRFSMTVRIGWVREDPVYFMTGGLISSVRDEKGDRPIEQLYRYYA